VFKPYCFYKHEAFKDVFIAVKKSYQVAANRYKITVIWMNYGQEGYNYPIGVEQKLDIKDLTGWNYATGDRFLDGKTI
jgi:hypothetical protein